MANTIIGNTEYKAIKEKAYINGTASEIAELAGELEKANIRYSGRISDYKSAVTVEASDRSAALEIMRSIKEAARKNSPSGNQPQNNIIGNAEYRFIKDKRFVKGETEAILRVADRLTAENISFSGRIYGDNATLTVSGDELQEKVKKYFAEEKSSSEVIRTAYMLAQSSVNLEDGYYISEVNVETGDEVQPYRSNYGDIPAFLSVDEAVRYAEGVGIALSNTDSQLNDWRRIEAEAEKEKERQLNLSRSREIIKRLPMTENGYEEHFIMRDDAVDWIYFNPDGADGEGQFVLTTLYEDDLLDAYNARNNTEDYPRFGQSTFIEVIQNGRQSIINADEEEFERLARDFINSRNDKNVIISAPVISGQEYNVNFERIIERLENHFDEVRKYKEKQLTETSENISVEGQIGTWYVVDSEVIDGKKLFLLEHETYGDEAANIIIDENKKVLMSSVWNGFDDYREMLQYNDGKEKINSAQAAELMDYGFTVYDRNHTDILPDSKETRDLFANDDNYFFYADKKDIEQFNVLSNAVSALDDLDSAARREAAQTGTEIDTIADYAKDMHDNGDCAYEWNDYGLTEWENIATSILSGDTEYIDSWLRDLRSALPSLEDNQNVSVDAVHELFENYKSRYNDSNNEIHNSEQLVSAINEIMEKDSFIFDNTNILFYLHGNGISCYDVSVFDENTQDYLSVAHISNTGIIKYYINESELSYNDKLLIEKQAKIQENEFSKDWNEEATEARFNKAEAKLNMLDNEKNNEFLSADEIKKGMSFKYDNINWEVVHVSNSVISLRNLDNRNGMGSKVVENWQNIIKRKNVEFLTRKDLLEEYTPIGKYKYSTAEKNADGGNIPLSEQLFELAKRELADYESSLDTAEKAKNSAYELVAKRDIFSYIKNNLADDISDSDVEEACKRLISSGCPLDTLYQEWLKNEYDNRMEAVGMTFNDVVHNNQLDIANDLHLNDNPITFSVVSINGRDNIVVGEYVDDESVRYMDEYMTAVSESSSDTVDVQVHFYTIGSIDTESVEADEAQVRYISEHLNEVLSQALLLEREMYEVEITDREIENSDRAVPDKNLEFTVVTFEDSSEYVLPGKIDDNNIVGTAAYEDMLKNNFDANKIEDLDESIKVKYAVYHTGDGEAVMPTDEEIAEIKNNLDDFIGGKEPVSAEESYLYAWKNVDDILFELEELWTEKHSADPQISDDFDADNYLLPERLSPIGQNGDTKYYETFSSVQQIKLKDSEWLDPVDAVVEMNRRGVNLDDIEMLNVDTVDVNGQHSQKDITPEQFAVYEKRIDGNLKLYDRILSDYRNALRSDSKEQREISENNVTLHEGDLVTFAARPYITWRVKSITDLQIDFENTNADAQEKIFSHIDFGQNRENLQETLQYTVISKGIESAREAAHKAGLPFRDTSNIPDYDPMEDFDPYAFDGTMSPEDFELMHKLMREDRFEIYQIKSGNEYHSKRFAELDELKETPNVSDYDLVYSGTLSDFDISGENKSDILESIFSKFNTDRPEDFKGHSLSVSDVVVLHKNDEDTAHYVDMIGFEDIPEFLKEKEKQISDKEITEADVQSEKEKFPVGESVRPSMITLSNDKISYVVVSEVRDALNDLYNGLAPDGEADGGYDWKNYYDAFRAVMDANTHGDIAYPLYNSDAERILRLAYSEDSDTVSDEEFKNALKNLDLVLQNSHLLANPEEKIEQLSFFGEKTSYVSSDEISYTSQEENISPNESTEKKKTEKEEKTAVDYTLTEENYKLQSGAKARFNDNIAAIKTLKNIEVEGRKATPAEQEILAKYVGWGGIPQAFDGTKNDWKKEYDELKKLLTVEEYKAAKASTLNAHYTTPTVINAIYSALENMGFNGGKILEPAMGIGNFFGAMPEEMRNNSNLTGVELDSISGRIAMQLYQSADIQINGYENTDFENESFDAAVGNVPFGSYKLNDKEYNKQNLLIHDYFFAKTLDKVRPGGVIAFVTSKGTLDKEKSDVRKYIAERAEFLGAVRLPNTAFKSNAGTEVTSDIIFLQKRDRPISIEENPPEWIFRDILPNGITVNKYFAEHPEMILGKMVEGNKLYGNQTDASMCVPIEGADLKEQFAEAIKNISGEYREVEKGRAEKEFLSEIPCPPGSPKFSYIVQDNTLYYRKSGSTMTRVEMPENSVKRIIAMAELRDLVHKLLDLQLENSDGKLSEIIDAARGELNKKYDEFSEKYGLLSSAENKKLFKDDNSYHLLKALEITDSSGHFLQKADIFTRNTINPKAVVDRCDNAEDALILSLSEKMRVDFDYMSILTGKSEEELIAELGNKIFQNPLRQMRWESADEYLTGNIRQKLAAAEKAGLQRNIDALNAVMPKRIEAADISVKLGSAWIDPEYVRQFIVETIKPDFITGKNISVTYSDVTDKWKVDGWQGGYANTLATETYGTAYMNAYQIIEASLNMKKAEVRERAKDENGNFITDKNGRYVLVVNHEKTMIVQAKQDELKRKFQDWIFADPDRRETLVQLYNEKFNSIRLREYDGSHLNFVGMNSAITLKEHQKNAVARALYSNVNTLLAHEVGGGKTYEMVAIAMEGKRLGLHNKSLITAPNALTEQWGEAFRTLYPNANVLVATEKDFKRENRRDLFAKIATGDWDAVIIGHSQFDMIHLSREREIDMLTSEVDRLEVALNEMNAEGNGRSFSVKQIEKTIKSYEEKIERLLSKTPEDDMLCFEKLGVDKIFVDESQAYKNLDTPTKMQNVSGIGSGGSGRSMQLLMKCKYLDEITGGKGTIFASGTPISNSMSELYTLMRYLQADKLAEMGISSFDQWASVFGETTTSMELSPEGNGKYQMKTRFAKFQNLPELMNIFKECADIKTAEALNLDRPDFEMHNINVPATKIQAAMIKELGERAKAIRSGTVEPTEDNMCKLTVDGRKIGLDQRCMNPNLPDDPNSKINVCIRNVFDIWQKTAEKKSTQMIFCDLATPQPPLNENRYYIYRKGENGAYSAVYSAKLSEKDTPEKIAKRLNEKPPKDYSGGIVDSDIIVTKNVDYESETAFKKGFIYNQGKLFELPDYMWEEILHTSPVEPFETERRFCVYDEIKSKLVSMGVPEKEIAFIHDAEKTVDKQLLFDKMNRGEIRVLIGSTQKCGAGMNAQERMIALHDIDAPMRPSDMSQRHGRIIRQGNTNKKVDIYRYTTDKTFDAYLYQMLENKQKFISQIMTDKSPVRSCEDVDEIALDYAEVKALCAGSPLIKEKIDLETEITKLKVLKSAFLSQKYSLQDKAYKILPERKNNAEIRIEKIKSDLEKCEKISPLTNDDGKKYYPVTVGETVYHDKEQAGEAIRQAILNSEKITEGKECKIGSYRGFEMSAFLDTLNKCIKVNLSGSANYYGEINMNADVKASGNIIRLDNIVNGIALELQKNMEYLQSINADIEEAKTAADAEFPQEQELAEKEKRLAEVDALLSSTDVHADNSKDLYAALIEICPELEQSGEVYCKLEKGADSGIEPFIIERSEDTVFVAHTYVQNGDLMYDPAIEFSFDTKDETAHALTYELSSMGIYKDLRGDENNAERSDIEEMALNTLFENVKAYNYEVKELRVGEEEQEEEIDYSQER